MRTFRTPNTRFRSKAERHRVRIHGRLASKLRASGESRKLRITLIEAGFIVLVVSTTWTIASISVWWVPVYLVMLVTIFVVPRRQRSPSSASEPGAPYGAVETTELGAGLRVECADGADQVCSASRSDFELKGESAESSDANPDLTAAGLTKLRRGRVRVRKAGKLADRPATEPVQVSWIRTGPGKFVRIEAGSIPADASTEDVSASGSVAEGYGIAPSAFSLAPEPNVSDEGSEDSLPGQGGESEGDTADRTEADRQLRSSFADSRPRVWQPRISRRRVVQFERGIVHAVSRSRRVSRQRVIRTYPRSRSLVELWFAANVPRQDAASRTSGRMLHAHRALRIRSPPAR